MRDDHSIAAILRVAAWLGIVSGIVEAAGLLVFQEMRWVRANALMWVSPEILWISPLSNLLLFLGLAVLLAAAMRLWVRTWDRLLPATLFIFLTVYDWLSVAAFGHLRRYALLMLSFGIAVSLIRLWRRHEESTFSFLHRTLPWLLALVPLLCLGIQTALALERSAAQKALAAAAPDSPNVVLLIVDALRADHLSSYGYERLTSPNLDKLAVEGALFENAFATSSWTLPSHTSLMTGRYPYEHRAEELLQAFDGRYTTLAEHFRAQGYRTAAFSANSMYFARGVGLGRGFAHFEDHFYSAPDWWIRTGFGREFYSLQSILGLPQNYPQRKRASAVRASMLDWLDRGGDHPFFIAANFFDTHTPYPPPPPFDSKFSGQAQPGVDDYDGAISYIDGEIKNLMDGLRSRGQVRNTIVVITSDHGESFGEHGLKEHRYALYRELIRVPLIFWWPGHIPGNTRVPQPVSLADVPATLASSIGIAGGNPFPGSSFEGLWRASAQPVDRAYPLAELAQMPPVVGMDTPAFRGSLKSLVNGGWHYIVSDKEGIELYNWEHDPGELQNLAATPDGKIIAQEFSSYLKTLMNRSR